MKIKKQHFEYIQSAVAPFDTEANRATYVSLGLSTTRYQWDLMRSAKLITWICDELYPYLNDSHIQTALNKIIKPLNIPRPR